MLNIPLSDFDFTDGTGINWNSIKSLQFHILDGMQGTGTIYVDSISIVDTGGGSGYGLVGLQSQALNPEFSITPQVLEQDSAKEMLFECAPFIPGSSIMIYSIAGTSIRSLAMEPGAGDVGKTVWDGLNDDGLPVAPGIYIAGMYSSGSLVSSLKKIAIK